MATHVAMAHQADQHGWSSLPSWGAPPRSCGGGNTWSKRLSAMATGDANDSWEERAFEEDSSISGAHWPPRSYSCSFCKRTFRTAQALGGHMNVHRRERAHNRLLNAGGSVAAAAANSEMLHLLGPGPAMFSSPQSTLSLPLSGPKVGMRAVPSPESISSGTLLGIPADILCAKSSCSSEREHAFHPYERSRRSKGGGQAVNLGRFSIPHEDSPAVDLELRLGRSSSGDR